MEDMGIWEYPVAMAEIEPPEIVCSSGYLYQRTKKGCELLRCDQAGATLTLPEEIDGLRLTVVGAGALRGMTGLRQIVLPKGLRRIGDYAFYQNEQLAEVCIPMGTRRIGRYAFAGCTGLQQAYVPPTVTEIGEGAFPADGELVLRGTMDSAVHRWAEENGIFFIAVREPAA